MLELLLILCVPAIVAGLIAGLFGLGGGAIIVPAVFYVLSVQGVEPEVAINIAVATSLATIVLTGASSAFSHHRLGNVDWCIVRRWLPFLTFGALLGATLVARVKTPSLIIVFGVFLWVIALARLLKPVNTPLKVVRLSGWPIRIIALIIGAVSAVVGVGGGTMSVPALQYSGRTLREAIGTSSAMGVVLALVATFWVLFTFKPVNVDQTLGLIYWPAWLVIMPCTLIFAPLGARLNQKISPKVLHLAFIGLLFLVGARMIWVGVGAH